MNLDLNNDIFASMDRALSERFGGGRPSNVIAFNMAGLIHTPEPAHKPGPLLASLGL